VFEGWLLRRVWTRRLRRETAMKIGDLVARKKYGPEGRSSDSLPVWADREGRRVIVLDVGPAYVTVWDFVDEWTWSAPVSTFDVISEAKWSEEPTRDDDEVRIR
jgi:hypothetical protein